MVDLGLCGCETLFFSLRFQDTKSLENETTRPIKYASEIFEIWPKLSKTLVRNHSVPLHEGILDRVV